MLHSTVNKIAHVEDRRHHVERQGSDWMQNDPIYPVHLNRKDDCFSSKEATLSARREKLIENLE